ncbi:MAG: YigZ family protein [Firmicutes bacterium ZCTH02-B6]|nr:MAG: YigZ family protein [Firmicutes bacterium ZCTH02-B6]
MTPPLDGQPSLPSYRTLGQFGAAEIVIKRSRFIGWGSPVETEDEALDVLNRIRTEHPQATHHCYAYRVGLGTETIRFSDDGEPGGTAGRPILEVLQREDLRNTLIVVTRYFGGTLLGAAGLVRAYTQAAKLAVETCGVVRQVRHTRFAVILDYEWVGKVQHWLQQQGAIVESTDYGAQAKFQFLVPQNLTEHVQQTLRDMTNGRASPTVLAELYWPIPDQVSTAD